MEYDLNAIVEHMVEKKLEEKLEEIQQNQGKPVSPQKISPNG